MKLSEKLKLVPFARSGVKIGAPHMEILSSVSYGFSSIKVVSSIREFEGMGVCKVVFWVSFK